METVAELKESMTVVKETLNEMQGELTATHEDVRYANRVTTLFTSVGNEADRVGPT